MNDTPCERLRDPHAFLDAEELGHVHATIEDLKRDRLWPNVSSVLRHGVFHVTGVKGWAGIKEAGSILPNDGGRTPMFEKSPRCRGWSLGGVCLFDFESPCIELVAKQWELAARYITLHPGEPDLTEEERVQNTIRTFSDPDYAGVPYRPVFIVQFEDRDALPGPWEYWRSVGDGVCPNDCVPYVECWHKAPMPLSAATAVHVLRQSAKQREERWRTYGVDESLTLDAA